MSKAVQGLINQLEDNPDNPPEPDLGSGISPSQPGTDPGAGSLGDSDDNVGVEIGSYGQLSLHEISGNTQEKMHRIQEAIALGKYKNAMQSATSIMAAMNSILESITRNLR
jgi:hypothetical protein